MRWLTLAALLAVACTRTSLPANPGQRTCQKGPPRAMPPRLLTRVEYDNTVRDLLGDTTQPAQAQLPKEPLAFGWENNADLYQPTPVLAAALVGLAEDVATRAMAERKATFVACATEDRTCAQGVVSSLGRRAFRRALTQDEAAALMGLYDAAAPKGFEVALTWVLEAILQSPQFLYRVEAGGPAGPDGTLALTGEELASRLSYLLWRSMPDEELLTAAESGALDTQAGRQAQAKRLLDSPKSADAVADFFRQYLSLDRLPELDKDRTSYPDFSAPLAQSWRDSFAAFAAEGWTKGHLADLYTSDALYADTTLAQVMDLHPAPPQGTVTRFAAPHPGGLLAQPGLLAYLASPDQSSPIRRGVFTYRQLMCQPIPDPPANLNVTIPPVSHTQTTRQRFDAHGALPGCSGCHSVIDPLGDGFEHFDGIGRWRDTDNGLPVDSSGAIVDAREAALAGPFDGTGELAARLAASRQVHDCFATGMFRFALGRVETPDDECALDQLEGDFYASGGNLRGLLYSIATSDVFRTRAAPEASP